MKFFRKVPAAPLNLFVDWLWYYEGLESDHERQHVLPDGTFELIINLSGEPRTLFGGNESADRSFRQAWISGAQSRFLVIDTIRGASMMGAHFRPGGAFPFLGMPADELTGNVVELEDFWGGKVRVWRERLLAVGSPGKRFEVFERLLKSQLSEASMPSKRVVWAMNRFGAGSNAGNVGSMAEELGISHKHFIQEFRRQVGLTPKLYCRIRRFQKVLARVNTSRAIDWAEVAIGCDYFDQAHFINDFQAFSGLNPSAYLRYRTDYPNFTRAAN